MENSTNVSVNPLFNGANSSSVLPLATSPRRITRKPLKRVPVHQTPADVSPQLPEPPLTPQPGMPRPQQQQPSSSPLIPEQPVLPSPRLPPQQQQQDSYSFPSGQDIIQKSQLITRTPSPATSVPTLQNQSVTPGVVGSPFAAPQDHTKSLSSGSFDFTDSQQFQLKQQQQNQPNMYGSVSPSLPQQQEILPQQQQSQQQQPQQQIHTRNSSVASHQPQQNRNRISSRFNSISSRSSSLVPSNTNDFNSHSNVSGSFYVHELRRRAATSWCDIPASVWGVPIGIAENALLHTNNGANGKINRASLVNQRRTMDIRHSHLTPRLLASEATQDDSDVISILGDRSTPGSKHIDNDTASIKSTITNTNHFSQQQQQQQQGQQSLSPLPSTLQRKNSVDSVKSLEQGFQRIKLFVANPDSDSD